MTVKEIVDALKGISLRQPNVRSAGDGSIYTYMNGNPSSRYTVFFVSQTTHRQTKDFFYFGANIFFVDRLDDSLEDNRLQVQSIAKEVLTNIIRTFCEEYDADYTSITFHPYTEKFTDLCAGMYATVELQIPLDYLCPEDF